MGSRRFVARAGLALVFAHGRYWTSVAPLVRRLLRDWEARASEIPDPHLNYLALEKLRSERFNVEVAAMIATIAPAEHRERAVEAIVALQVMYDFLDALTEQLGSNVGDDFHKKIAFSLGQIAAEQRQVDRCAIALDVKEAITNAATPPPPVAAPAQSPAP